MTASLPFRRYLKFYRQVGRIGVMVTAENVADMYGQKNSRGRTYHLSIWRNPA